MSRNPIPILSFFCGAGGLDRGFSSEKFRVVLACDNFDPAIRSYNFNARRRIARLADLNTISSPTLFRMVKEQSPEVPPQGIVGGPPCQGFSRGNAQADPQDPR